MSLRPEVLAFATAMERKLRARDQRGLRGWLGMPYVFLLQRLREETWGLQTECDLHDLAAPERSAERVLDHAVDVANFAMMAADKAGALESTAPAGWYRDDQATELLLRIAGCDVPLETIFLWSDDQVREAEAWAGTASILRAGGLTTSGSRPAHVPAPWSEQDGAA